MDASYHADLICIAAKKSENCIQIKVNNLGHVTAKGQNLLFKVSIYKYALSPMSRIAYEECDEHEINNHQK